MSFIETNFEDMCGVTLIYVEKEVFINEGKSSNRKTKQKNNKKEIFRAAGIEPATN